MLMYQPNSSQSFNLQFSNHFVKYICLIQKTFPEQLFIKLNQ